MAPRPGPTQDSHVIHCPNLAPRRSLIEVLWSGDSRRDSRGARIAASGGDSPLNSRYVLCEATTWKRNEFCYGKSRYAGTASGGADTRTSFACGTVPARSSGAGIRSWIVGPNPGFHPGSGPTIQDLIPPPRQLCHSLWPRRCKTRTRTRKRGSVLCCPDTETRKDMENSTGQDSTCHVNTKLITETRGTDRKGACENAKKTQIQ